MIGGDFILCATKMVRRAMGRVPTRTKGNRESTAGRKTANTTSPEGRTLETLAGEPGPAVVFSFSISPRSRSLLDLVNNSRQMQPTAVQNSARRRLAIPNASPAALLRL